MNQIIFRQGTLKWKEKVFPVDFALINEKKVHLLLNSIMNLTINFTIFSNLLSGMII